MALVVVMGVVLIVEAGGFSAQLLAQSTAQAAAQSAEGDEFQAKANRLQQAVLRRPRAGATFDLWYGHYQRAGREADWQQECRRLLDEQPEDGRRQLLWGLACERVADWPAAAEAYRRAAERLPGDYNPLIRLAAVLQRLGQLDAATDVLSQALDLKMPPTEFLSSARQLARLSERLGRRQQRIEVYQRLAERLPRDLRVVTEAATELQRLDEIALARTLWQQVRTSARDTESVVTANWQLAKMAEDEADWNEALSVLAQVLDQVEPTSWRATETRRMIDQVLTRSGRDQGGIEFWHSRYQAQPNNIDRLMEYAAALASDDRLAEAIKLYQEGVERAPARRDLRAQWVELLVRDGRFPEAVAELSEQAEANPTDPELWFALGQNQLQRTDQERASAEQAAIAAWQRAVSARPADASLALRAAELCRDAALARSEQTIDWRPQSVFSPATLRAGQRLLPAAETFYRQAVQREQSRDHLRLLGEFLHRLGRSDDAQQTWLALCTDEAPNDCREAARTLQRFGYFAAARRVAESLVENDAGERESWQTLLDILLEQRDSSAALRLVERMQQVHSVDPVWQHTVAELQVRVVVASGQIDETIERLQHERNTSATKVSNNWALAQLLLRTGRGGDAVGLLSELVRDRPRDITLRHDYANALVRNGDLELAVRQYERIIDQSDTPQRDIYQRLTELLLQLRQYEKAADVIDRFVRQAPRDVDALLLQARVAGAGEQPEQRLEVLHRAAALSPEDPQVQRQLVQALVDQDDVTTAMQQVPQLLDAAVGSAERIAVVSWVLSWASRPEQQQELRELIESRRHGRGESEHDWTLCLVSIYEQTGQPERALNELSELHVRAPLDFNRLNKLVDLAQLAQNWDDAVHYQKQLTRLSDSAMAWEKLARLNRQAGRLDEANEIWDRLLTRRVGAEESIRIVDRLLAQGDVYGAQRLAEAAMSRHPTNWQLQFRTALLHLAAEQYSAAWDAFHQVLQQSDASGERVTDVALVEQDLQPLAWALSANRVFRDIVTRRQQLGARHHQVFERFADESLLREGGSTSLLASQVYSAAALLDAFPADYVRSRGGNAATGSNPEHGRSKPLAAAAWASQRFEIVARWARDESGRPHEALCHWFELLSPAHRELPFLTEFDRVHRSLRWLSERRPAEQRELHRLWVGWLSGWTSDRDWLDRTKQQG